MIRTIHIKQGQTVLQACQEQGIQIGGVCNGRMTCGKCKVKVHKNKHIVTNKDSTYIYCKTETGEAEGSAKVPSERELRILTDQEAEEGFRLACVMVPDGDCLIEIPDAVADELVVVTADELQIPKSRPDVTMQEKASDNGKRNRFLDCSFAIVADVGTTTLAMQLIVYDNYEVTSLATYTAANRQRSYGADVLSRIEAACSGQGMELRNAVLSGLLEGIGKLLAPVTQQAALCGAFDWQLLSGEVRSDTDEKGTGFLGDSWIPAVREKGISHLVLAGNTTMVHLMMGYSCEQLGKAPFRPVSTDSVQMKVLPFFEPVSKEEKAWDSPVSAIMQKTELFIFPGISAFVGGDIVSGMYVTGLYKSAGVQILVDLGTNGEIVIGNRMRMMASSTAAGPAFEGGGISCGCASVKGAICGCSLLEDGSFALETIGGAEPVGICGSGLFEILYELLRAGRMDETGLLAEGSVDRIYLYGEKIYLTQQDIRQFQMAKAAVCAGMETLMRKYGAYAGDVERIYIAGGFGYSLNLKKAAALGLFPDGCDRQLLAVGNTSLAGCRSFLLEDSKERLDTIRKYTMVYNLAETDVFQEKYLERMYFPSLTC